jgi:hypothetical protein
VVSSDPALRQFGALFVASSTDWAPPHADARIATA